MSGTDDAKKLPVLTSPVENFTRNMVKLSSRDSLLYCENISVLNGFTLLSNVRFEQKMQKQHIKKLLHLLHVLVNVHQYLIIKVTDIIIVIIFMLNIIQHVLK